jgi:hypothetical protein
VTATEVWLPHAFLGKSFSDAGRKHGIPWNYDYYHFQNDMTAVLQKKLVKLFIEETSRSVDLHF